MRGSFSFSASGKARGPLVVCRQIAVGLKRRMTVYEIRRITPHEVDDAIKLSEYSFKYVLEGEKRQQRVRFMEDHVVFGVFHEGEMIAKTHIIPHSILVDGKEYAMGGIASVSTYPEHRRKGIVNRLMDTALLTMKEAGQVLSYLHPFDVSFYRKYGYELISSLKKLTVNSRDLNFYKGVTGTIKRTSPEIVLADISGVYHQFARQYNGMLVRRDKWWRDTKFHGNTAAVHYDEQGSPTGYILYAINSNTLEVKEHVYLNENSRRSLWNFIANHDSMIEKVEILTTEHEPMAFLFQNPAVKTEIIPDFMGRVVLVKEFLSGYIEGSTVIQPLTLAIEDSSAEWNTGVYTISDKGISFSPGLDGKHAADLSMDIRGFTVLLLGCQSPEFLYNSGIITGSQDALPVLMSLLTQRKTAYIDYF